jgi:O-antigen/teichoic acid export membrane protein
MKYTAEALGRADQEDATRVVQTALVFNLLAGSAGMIALALGARWLANSAFAVPPELVARAVIGFRVMGLVWFLGVIAATYGAVIIAYQRYDLAARLAVLSAVLTPGLGLIVALAGGDIVTVVLAQAVAGAVLLAVTFQQARRLLPGIAARPRYHSRAFGRSLSFGSWQVIGMLGGLMSGWADRYVLGVFFAPAILGAYSTANLLQTQLSSTFFEVGEVLLPAVSHLEGRGDLPAARRLALLVGWTLTSGFGICAAVLGAVGGDFLHLWISPGVALATTATLRILCAASIAGIAALAPLHYLLGIGKARWDAGAGLAVGVIVTGVTAFLVPRLGLPGVGYGLLAGTLSRWVLIFFVWRLHFRPQFGLASFGAHVWVPPVVSIGTMLLLERLHDALGRAPTWPWLLGETAIVFLLAGAIQLGVSEILPGGAGRRRDVVSSFRPIIAKATGPFSAAP